MSSVQTDLMKNLQQELGYKDDTFDVLQLRLRKMAFECELIGSLKQMVKFKFQAAQVLYSLLRKMAQMLTFLGVT